MIRILGQVFGAFLLAAFATGDALAQTKKKDPRCVPNFFQACQKRCIGAGEIGQAAADNRIDHTERPRTTEAADNLIATIVPLSSAGRG